MPCWDQNHSGLNDPVNKETRHQVHVEKKELRSVSKEQIPSIGNKIHKLTRP